jgi:DNA polymerase III subunit epsilon
MRQIILDTETTGLEWANGNRIIEIGCIELINRQQSGNHFHRYINPQRDSEEGALRVHGLTTEFLSDKPKFSEIVNEFLDYVKGGELVIHNAKFDVGFLNAELERVNLKPMTEYCASVIDTIAMAKELNPGKRAGLDALCERYQIDNSARTLHGALLDAQLLAEVYLAMTRGQDSLLMDIDPVPVATAAEETARGNLELMVLRASDEEIAAHEQQLVDIDKASGGKCVWRKQ